MKLDRININKFNLIFKIMYLIHMFCSFTVYGAGNKITLIPTIIVAAILILYRVFNIKIYINYPNVKILVLFLISYVISSIITVKYGVFENIQCFIWMLIQFVLLYTFNISDEENTIINEFKIISMVFLTILFIANVCSIGMLLMNYSAFYKAFDGANYLVGITSWGRLFGIFTDPNYASVMSTVGFLLCIYCYRTTKNKYLKIFAIINIIIQFLFISFAGSRTALVALMFAMPIYIILNYINKIDFKNIIKSIIIILVCCTTIYFAISGIVKIYNCAFEIISKNNSSEYINIGREEEITKDISNRRFDIWKSGFEIFKSNPVFGISFKNIVPYALDKEPETYIINNDFAIFDAFHNTAIDILVVQGIIGILIAFVLAINILKIVAKNLKNKYNSSYREEQNVLLAICATIIVSAMFVSHIFYVNIITTYLFWLFLGYLLVLLQK